MSEAEAREALVQVLAARVIQQSAPILQHMAHAWATQMKPLFAEIGRRLMQAITPLARWWMLRMTLPNYVRRGQELKQMALPAPMSILALPPPLTTEQLQRMVPPLPLLPSGLMKSDKESREHP